MSRAMEARTGNPQNWGVVAQRDKQIKDLREVEERNWWRWFVVKGELDDIKHSRSLNLSLSPIMTVVSMEPSDTIHTINTIINGPTTPRTITVPPFTVDAQTKDNTPGVNGLDLCNLSLDDIPLNQTEQDDDYILVTHLSPADQEKSPTTAIAVVEPTTQIEPVTHINPTTHPNPQVPPCTQDTPQAESPNGSGETALIEGVTVELGVENAEIELQQHWPRIETQAGRIRDLEKEIRLLMKQIDWQAEYIESLERQLEQLRIEVSAAPAGLRFCTPASQESQLVAVVPGESEGELGSFSGEEWGFSEE